MEYLLIFILQKQQKEFSHENVRSYNTEFLVLREHVGTAKRYEIRVKKLGMKLTRRWIGN